MHLMQVSDLTGIPGIRRTVFLSQKIATGKGADSDFSVCIAMAAGRTLIKSNIAENSEGVELESTPVIR